MPIQSEDIKILKSAVMADVPEGGGGMTGNAVVDGLSNAVFNDISDDNRAHGAFHLRKLFGIAHTDDTSLLLGAGWAVLKPPTDPNVDVTVFETDGWFDERTDALTLVESYLVKGPRLLCRVQDTHYAGTGVLQLYNPAPATSFPAAGDSIILRNPDGTEQRLRATVVTFSTAIVYDESGAYTVNLATCELNRPLNFDLLGKPVQRTPPSVSTTATVFSTVPAAGAQFGGVKPLATAVVLGSEPIRSVTVDGGIFAQLVPATTLPTPVADIYPLVQRPSLSRTGSANLSVVTATVALTAGTVLQLPTAAEPGTLAMTHGATAFTTTPAGNVLQGSTVVGVVDWAGRTLTMSGASPNYGSATNTLTYKPATVTGATVHSLAHVITDANQSTAFVAAMEPPPAPGTYSLDYMAQGQWYQIADDGTGKVSGSDSTYGAGTVSYVTGSFSGSMGALPDVGSTAIQTWGEADSARAATGLPVRAWADIPLTKQPEPGTLALAWSFGGSNYSATVSATGVVTGPAQVGALKRLGVDDYALPFSPDTLPDGPVTVTFNEQTENAAFTNDGGGAYTLTGAPIAPGSARFQLLGTSGAQTRVYNCYSAGTQVFAVGVGVIGTINNTTGEILLTGGTQDVTTWTKVRVSRSMALNGTGAFYGPNYYYKRESSTITFTLDLDGVLQIGYLPAAGAVAQSLDVAPNWQLDLNPPLGLELVTSDAAFTWAGVVHFLRSGIVYKGWHAATGATAAVGAASSNGLITLGATAPGASNAVVWSNAAHDARGSLDVLGGVFRVASAPIQAGLFQLQSGALIGTANSGGILSGDFEGLVDSQRGVVRWAVTGLGPTEVEGAPVRADEVTYNAVFLQYVPLDIDLLGVDTAGLPADGRVPIYRAGGGIFVHHTDTFTLPDPVVKGTAYDVGRQRVASLVLRDAIGTRLPVALYDTDKNAGTVTVKVAADISTYALPLKAEHRVQDKMQVARADISGLLELSGALSHNYPVPGSYVSSDLRQGDKFARVFGYADRTTWLSNWAATEAGSNIGTASFNSIDHPITTTNRGAITERWAAIFNSSTTTVNIIGEGVGQIATNVPIAEIIAPINPVTLVPYFSMPPAGWGGGWSAGNVLLWETQACGAPAWIARSVLPGATEVLDDAATIAYLANVDTI
jgi:hypothetical protein